LCGLVEVETGFEPV